MELNYKKLGDSGQHLIILHGLFGSLDNWMTLGKELSEDYQVWLVDNRNHGQSPHSDLFDYPTMANDLKQFVTNHQIDSPVVIGHSMGGKVAMHFASFYPELLEKLIVVDIAPVNYPVHHAQILSAMRSIDFSKVDRRGDVDKLLAKKIEEVGVRQFLLKNLYWETKEKLAWRFNFNVLDETIEEISAGMNINTPYSGDALFIAGGKSDYIIAQYHPRIQEFFPQSSIKTIAHAGHWIHAEAPEDFLTLVKGFIKR